VYPGCLYEWGRNFDDMPSLPSENNLVVLEKLGTRGPLLRRVSPEL
jgi:hypothetical protein